MLVWMVGVSIVNQIIEGFVFLLIFSLVYV